MNAYRTPPQARSSSDALSYDYAKALARKRSRVVYDSIRFTLWILVVVGLYPFVALFGNEGMLIGIAAFAFVGVPLAIRKARQTGENEIEAYEGRLLAKARKRSRKKRC